MVSTSAVTGQISGQVIERNCDPPAGAVERRRLVKLARDIAEAGEEQEDVEPDRPPDRQHRHHRQDPGRHTEHGDRPAERSNPISGASTP